MVPNERTRGNREKLKYRRLLNIRIGFFFTLRRNKQQNKLFIEVAETPSLDTFKTQPDTALSNMLYLTCFDLAGWD